MRKTKTYMVSQQNQITCNINMPVLLNNHQLDFAQPTFCDKFIIFGFEMVVVK